MTTKEWRAMSASEREAYVKNSPPVETVAFINDVVTTNELMDAEMEMVEQDRRQMEAEARAASAALAELDEEGDPDYCGEED